MKPALFAVVDWSRFGEHQIKRFVGGFQRQRGTGLPISPQYWNIEHLDIIELPLAMNQFLLEGREEALDDGMVPAASIATRAAEMSVHRARWSRKVHPSYRHDLQREISDSENWRRHETGSCEESQPRFAWGAPLDGRFANDASRRKDRQ